MTIRPRPSSRRIAAALVAGGALFLVGLPFMAYFWTSWIFALPLVLDKQIDFWPAMKLSRRVVRLHWWRVFGVLALTVVLIGGVVVVASAVIFTAFFAMNSAGSTPEAALGVAVLLGLVFLCLFFAVIPVSYSAVAVAYETIFGEHKAA